MIIPTPSDIKRIRHKLGLTQSEVSSLAGVSQSLIARIENGSVDPRLSTLRKIFDAFDSARKEKTFAINIMSSPVIHTSSKKSIEEAVAVMQKYGFSQMPVIDNGVPVGSISTDKIVHSMIDKDVKKISHLSVESIMEDSFPTISPTTDTNSISRILENNPAVLVVDKGKVIGVVTKHDIMKILKE